MAKVIIEISNNELIKSISRLSLLEIKNLMRKLFLLNLYQPPKFEEISEEVSRIIKSKNLTEKDVEESIEWARKQK